MKYFDNAATSFPKLEAVGLNMLEYMNDIGGSYGRSYYPAALKVANVIEDVRDKLAVLLNVKTAENVIFAANATFGINTIINGLNLKNCEVVVSRMEHNAVMRPLKRLEIENNIKIKYLSSEDDGYIKVENLKKIISKKTSLAIINHQSNVNGVIQPLKEIKEEIGEIPLLVDLAQSFGDIEVDLDNWHIDFASFTGHKALLGPTGTGGFYIKNQNMLEPLLVGGTGSKSESFDYPEYMPDKFESGTPNIAGIFGLSGALENKPSCSRHSNSELLLFIDEIKNLKSYKVYAAKNKKNQGKVFSINSDFLNCAELGRILSEKYNIATRAGLHCAPLAHRTLGTYPDGALRISPSIFHTSDDFNYVLKALYEIKKGRL
jgi:cysteine desulfurase family protein